MLLLITGCVQVDKNMPFVKITDKNNRLDAYFETVRWAIEDTIFDKIVFCENSNFEYDFAKYEKMAKKANKVFEYLTFTGDSKTSNQKGKGYGEGEIISFALTNSELLKDEEFFCKITGRLKVSNVNLLLKSTNLNYFMNKRLLKEVDTRFYGIKKKDFLYALKDSYKDVDDYHNYYLEHAYYHDLNTKKIKYRAFYERPLFIGVAGSTGRIYEDKRWRNEKIFSFLFKTDIYNSRFFWKILALLKRK